MMQKGNIHEYAVMYEDTNAKEGYLYLRDDLDSNESKVFFEQAKREGEAEFEDDNERQFTLAYQSSVYTIIRR